MNWDAVEFASSYNVYRDGVLVGTTESTTYIDPEGAGFGLGYSTEYCYTVSTNNAGGVAGPFSDQACATTLPYVLAGLDINVDPSNKLIYVQMVNFWTISGYQFDINLDDNFNILGVDDSNSLLTASYANGRVVGFSLTGDLIAPNPAGTLLAVLAYEPNGNNFGGTFEASVSNFVFADENYMELNVCDLDFNPLNGCEVSTTFDYSIDCNGDDYGDAYLDSCGVCSGGNSGHEADSDNLGCGCFNDAALSYWFDIDGDGLGSGVSEDFCLADLPEGWVLNNDDEYPDCDSLQAFSDIRNLSSKLKSPFSINSKAIIDVIILVIEAG